MNGLEALNGHVAPEVQRILEARARRMAVFDGPSHSKTGDDALACRLGAERYLLPLRDLRGVERCAGLTPIPCTPPHVAGLLAVRGETVAVVDLRAALGLPGAPVQGVRAEVHDEQARVVLVDRQGDVVGLLVDEVLGIEAVDAGLIGAPLSESRFTLGVASGGSVALNLEELVGSGALEVHEDVA